MTRVLFYNAKIWKSASESYSWMIVDQATGKIARVGSSEVPSGENISESHDLQQQWIFPGFHDSHMHAEYLGRQMNKKHNLQLPASVAALKEKLRLLTSDVDGSNNDWFVGHGWDHINMDRLPTKEDLDEVVPHRPVLLYRVCYHVAVVNSKALALAGITAATEDPDNGVIDRFPQGHDKAGEPNGVVREDGGVGTVLKVVPPLSSEQKKENISTVLQECLKFGLTSIHPVDECCWKEYVSLANEDKLPIHCYFSAWYVDMGTDNFPLPGEQHGNVSCHCVKIFADGALNTETAALSEPYAGSTKNGVLQFSKSELEVMIRKVNDAGFRLEIHVIGDRAAEIVLDCLEKCEVPPENRTILVHCQILRDDLLGRMKNLGVVPTIQPSFVVTDSRTVRKILPVSLQKCIYPWKTLLQHGIPCGGSSDAPVETLNPLQGIYDAIFRTDMTCKNGDPFIKEECLTFEEAVHLYTSGSAYADGVENIKGKLESGYQADFVLLQTPHTDKNMPVNLPEHPELLKSTVVKEVWIKGKCAWKKSHS